MSVRQRELVQGLVGVGLPEAEAEVYYHLTMAGQAKAAEVAQATGRRRPDMYPLLERLVQKGLVQSTTGRPAVYVPIDIGDAMDRLIDMGRTQQRDVEHRAKALVESWPRLREDMQSPVERMAIHEGLPQILATLKQRVDAAQHHVLAAISPSLLHRIGEVRERLAAKAGDADVRILTTIHSASDAEALGAARPLEVRHQSLPSHLDMVLIDSKELFLFMSAGRADSTHGNPEQVLWLRTADVTLAMQAIHDMLWAQGVPLEARLADLRGEPRPETELIKGRWVRDHRVMAAVARAELDVCILADDAMVQQWHNSGVWAMVARRQGQVRVHVVADVDIAGIDAHRPKEPSAMSALVVVDRREAICVWRPEGGGPDGLWSTHPDVVQMLLDGMPEVPALQTAL